MAIESYTVQLERVQAGIAEMEASMVKSTSHGDRQLVRQDLQVLYDRERYLRDKVAEETAGGGVADGPIRVRGLTPYV